jgi:hypothetical protein
MVASIVTKKHRETTKYAPFSGFFRGISPIARHIAVTSFP